MGRGRHTQSYVPVVAEVFHNGRRWLDETSNAPYHFNRAQIMSMPMDNVTFERIEHLIQGAKRNEN